MPERDDEMQADARDDAPDDAPLDAPLGELYAAWRALEPPEPTAPVDRPDPATQATIDWLRAAWRRAGPTPPITVSSLPWRIRLRLLRPRVGPAIAAAAALLLFALLIEITRRGPDAVSFTPGTTVAAQPLDPPALVPQALAPQPLVTPPVTVDPTSTQTVASITSDRMEMRSGPVRLILFTSLKPSDTKELDR